MSLLILLERGGGNTQEGREVLLSLCISQFQLHPAPPPPPPRLPWGICLPFQLRGGGGGGGGGGVLRTYHGLKVKKKRIAVNKNPCSRFTAIFENSFIFIVVVVDRMRFAPFCGLF